MTVGVRVTGAVKAYRSVPALQGVDIEAAAGETLAILGPSGCGKTTLLRAVAGLESLDEGTVFFGDDDVTQRAPARRDVAMVFQNHALLPHLSVAENIAFGLRTRRLGREEVQDRLSAAAALSDCDHLLERWPAQLSGGERQRVALARAVARQPAVLLLDEPLASLDVQLRSRLRLDLRRVFDELGVTAIHVTHDQAEAQALGRRVAVMEDGRVRQIGTPDEIYDRPADRFVAGFVGVPAMNLLEVVDGDPPHAGPFAIALGETAGGGRLDAGIRAEALQLTGDGRGASALVEAVDPSGADAVVTVDAGGHRLVVLVARHLRPSPGQHVSVDAPAQAFHLFDRQTGMALRHPDPS
ncbi:MAG: ABC transporter ATP-binding protein [Acidimicrobiales bacterium]